MRYSQGDGVNTSLSKLVLYPRLVYSCRVFDYVILCVWKSTVARSCAAWDDNNKDNVCKPNTPAGIKCPPPSKTISLITRFGTILNKYNTVEKPTVILYYYADWSVIPPH